MTYAIKIKDKRIAAIANGTLDRHFNHTYSKLDVNKFSECLIKETVKHCMKQIGMVVNLDNPTEAALMHKMWEHLATRYDINTIKEGNENV